MLGCLLKRFVTDFTDFSRDSQHGGTEITQGVQMMQGTLCVGAVCASTCGNHRECSKSPERRQSTSFSPKILSDYSVGGSEMKRHGFGSTISGLKFLFIL